MKTKAKKFSHKLLALFMAVLMAASCLTCAFSAHAAPVSSEKQYTDDALEYNDLAWNILSDEQAATALNGEYDLYCDFNGDNSVDALDTLTFVIFYGNAVEYAPRALD